jgi:hypothetical protein
VHGTGVYSARVGPKGPALERFLDIKKKKMGPNPTNAQQHQRPAPPPLTTHHLTRKEVFFFNLFISSGISHRSALFLYFLPLQMEGYVKFLFVKVRHARNRGFL